jgi:hypothetical protein
MPSSDPAASQQTPAAENAAVRAIAYYLPQYHPIPENDEWWGKGFTEWTNVTRAKPLFDGHYQPHLPTELGFYDLRLPEVRIAQAELARRYGVHGFCYYYYSFGEKRLLERPLLDMVRSGVPDFPFCICWANESWTRRWDGAEAQVLVAQDDSAEGYRRFIHEVLPILLDARYIRVNGAPLVLVYRARRIPDAPAVAAYWREAAVAAGLPGLYLCSVQSHDPQLDPRSVGFDAAVEFPPSPWGSPSSAQELPGLSPDFTGAVFDYREFATSAIARTSPPYRLLRGVMTDWDNTARRGPAAYLFKGSSPREYETWLRAAVAWTRAHNPPEERLVFVNAWNEWAEGAHLEPDERHGRAWLEATERALSRAHDWRGALDALRREPVDPAALRPWLDDLELALDGLGRARQEPAPHRTALRAGMPDGLGAKPVTVGLMQLEAVQGRAPRGRITVRRGQPLRAAGWSVAPGVPMARSQGLLMLRSPNGDRVFTAPIGPRTARHDVSFRHRQLGRHATELPGFDVELETAGLAPGEYRLSVLHATAERVVAAHSEHRVVVE